MATHRYLAVALLGSESYQDLCVGSMSLVGKARPLY